MRLFLTSAIFPAFRVLYLFFNPLPSCRFKIAECWNITDSHQQNIKVTKISKKLNIKRKIIFHDNNNSTYYSFRIDHNDT
jgi:hypothetical protein